MSGHTIHGDRRRNRRRKLLADRGNSGGFELPPARLHTTVLEIVEAIEGPIHLNVCLKSFEECSRTSICPAYPVWIKSAAIILDVLGGINIEEMARQSRERGTPETVKLLELPCT